MFVAHSRCGSNIPVEGEYHWVGAAFVERPLGQEVVRGTRQLHAEEQQVDGPPRHPGCGRSGTVSGGRGSGGASMAASVCACTTIERVSSLHLVRVR